MRASIRRGVAALAVALGLLAVSAPASAQAPAQAPPSTEQVQLGIQFSEQMLGVVDFNALMAKSMAASLDAQFAKVEPKWRDFLLEALAEEIKADHGAIAATMGRAFARSFTADELRVGLAVFRDPAMPVVMKALGAGQPAPAGVNLQPATLQAMTTPAGRTFSAKFGNLAPIMDSAQSDLIHVIIPGFFQRFGDKAMALERQRRQAEGLPLAAGG